MRVRTVPIVVLAGVFATGVVSDVISGNAQGTGLSALATCMISAALMPWGAGFQTALVLATALPGALSVWLVSGSLETLGYAAGPGVIVVLASISVAHAFERARRDRLRLEEELRLLQSVSVEVGAAPDQNLAIHLERELPALILAADELEDVTRGPRLRHDSLTRGEALGLSERPRVTA